MDCGVPMVGTEAPVQSRCDCSLGVGGYDPAVDVDGKSAMVTPAYSFVDELAGGLRDPVDLVVSLVGCGVSPEQAAGVAQAYYQVCRGGSGSSASSAVSSKGSLRKQERTLRWQIETASYPDQPGMCYLQVIRWGRRKAYKRDLGMCPTLSKLLEYMVLGDVDVKLSRQFNVYVIPSLGGFEPSAYHVAKTFDGHCLGSVYDVLAAALRLGSVKSRLVLDAPVNEVLGVDASLTIGAVGFSDCTCVEQLDTKPLYVLPTDYIDCGSQWSAGLRHSFVTARDSWSVVEVYSFREERGDGPAVVVPEDLVTAYACGMRYVLSADAVFLTPPGTAFEICSMSSREFRVPAVTYLTEQQRAHWLQHVRTNFGDNSALRLPSDYLHVKPVGTEPVDTHGLGVYELPVKTSLWRVRVGFRRKVYITVVNGAIVVDGSGALVSASQTIVCYPTVDAIGISTYAGATISVSLEPYDGLFLAHAPDLVDLLVQDFPACRCLLHRVPITKSRSFSNAGCCMMPHGSAAVLTAAFLYGDCRCGLDDETRAKDYRFLRLVLSVKDPMVLDGAIRSAHLRALCDFKRVTTIDAFGNGYCYLHLMSPDFWWRVARTLGPNPRVNSVLRVMLWAGRSGYISCHIYQVKRGFYHVEPVYTDVASDYVSMRVVYAHLLQLVGLNAHARIGAVVDIDGTAKSVVTTIDKANFAILIACASMLVSVLVLLVKLVFMRHWYV